MRFAYADPRAELIEAARLAIRPWRGALMYPSTTTAAADCVVDAVLARLDQLGVHREQDGQ